MISIIMSTYNGEEFLAEQIDSILNQDYEDWKLFIFDDGSKDRTEEIVREYQKKREGKIFFLRNERNFGAKGNFFRGLKKVAKQLEPKSEYYAFSDQDDVWDRDKLSLSLSRLKEIEEEGFPAAVFSDVRTTDKTLKILEDSYFKGAKINMRQLDFASVLMENKAIGGTMLMNKAMVQLEMEREDQIGDVPKQAKMHDWWFALLGIGLGRVAFLERATESYRQHERNVVGGKSFFSYVKNRIFHYKLRKSIEENILQGEEFQEYFGEFLKSENKEILENFVKISKSGFLRRRYLLVKYGFWKSGWIRNVALFLFL